MTLTASIASTSYFDDERGIAGFVIALLTPVLAAILSIIAGFSQSFQWGAVWKDIVMTATAVAVTEVGAKTS